jgi:hypothetical protein
VLLASSYFSRNKYDTFSSFRQSWQIIVGSKFSNVAACDVTLANISAMLAEEISKSSNSMSELKLRINFFSSRQILHIFWKFSLVTVPLIRFILLSYSTLNRINYILCVHSIYTKI